MCNFGLLIGSEHGSYKELSNVDELFGSIWPESWWLIVLFLSIALVKRVLLRQSTAEIVACAVDAIAFLLMHTIDVARYVALQLRKLARDLREIEA